MKRLVLLVSLVALFGLDACKQAPASTAVTCTTTTSTSSSTSSVSTCTDPVTNISVTISPATVSVNVVTEQQFQVFISGGTNSIPIWKVNNIQGGDDTVGRIDSSGLYHAPVTVPPQAIVSVTAGSTEDPNVVATSKVTIIPAPVVKITSPTPPVAATSGSANAITFTATETGGSTTTILWYVGPVGGIGVLGGNATFGMINASGVYSPPAAPPLGGVVTVTAAAQDSPSSTDSLNVTISGYSTSSLVGQFAFSLAGMSASGRFFRAGSFVADGLGNLTTVVEDVNPASGVTAPISTTGTYTVGANGHGTLRFSDGLTPALFDFVLVNGTDLQVIGFDNSGTAAGEALAQDISTFGNSALRGSYVFDFSGAHGANGLSEIGEFTADGAGNITGGTIDVNDNGSLSQLQIIGNTAAAGQPPSNASTYTPPALPAGRGTLTLVTAGGPLHFSFYVVSRGVAKFVGTDSETSVGAVQGTSAQQNPNGAFSPASLNGNYAFLLSGSGSGGGYASAGSFFADGQGNVSSGVLDESLSGTPNPNIALSGVINSVASNGRGTMTLTGGRAYVFYLGSAGTGVFQETDTTHANIVGDGLFKLQQNLSFALTQISGTYAVATSGLSGSSAEDIIGNFTAGLVSGAPTVSSADLDLNTGGVTNPAVGTSAGSTFAASSPAERATLTLILASSPAQTRNFAMYVVSSNEAYLVEIDTASPVRLAGGKLLLQF